MWTDRWKYYLTSLRPVIIVIWRHLLCWWNYVKLKVLLKEAFRKEGWEIRRPRAFSHWASESRWIHCISIRQFTASNRGDQRTINTITDIHCSIQPNGEFATLATKVHSIASRESVSGGKSNFPHKNIDAKRLPTLQVWMRHYAAFIMRSTRRSFALPETDVPDMSTIGSRDPSPMYVHTVDHLDWIQVCTQVNTTPMYMIHNTENVTMKFQCTLSWTRQGIGFQTHLPVPLQFSVLQCVHTDRDWDRYQDR